MKQYLVECIGTFFLVLTIALTGNPIAIGIVLASLVYWGGFISGAHYNPAVTLTFFLRKKMNQTEATRYMLSQFTGSILASFVSTTVFIKPVSIISSSPWTTSLIAEALFTFILCSVVLHVAAHKKTQGNQYYGLAIGGIVLAGAFAVGNISGGAFNPAVGLGPLFTNVMLGRSLFDPSLLFLYILGPGIGALSASWVFDYISDQKE